MAGSYAHATTDAGNLRSNESFVQMVENLGDAYETVEEMYGMIWWLATEPQNVNTLTKDAIEEARKNFKEGLKRAKECNRRDAHAG